MTKINDLQVTIYTCTCVILCSFFAGNGVQHVCDTRSCTFLRPTFPFSLFAPNFLPLLASSKGNLSYIPSLSPGKTTDRVYMSKLSANMAQLKIKEERRDGKLATAHERRDEKPS